jgi:hypothetical protein
MFDKIFKVGIVVLGILFILVLYSLSQNGRYQNFRPAAEGSMLILDTHTGLLYGADERWPGKPGFLVERPEISLQDTLAELSRPDRIPEWRKDILDNPKFQKQPQEKKSKVAHNYLERAIKKSPLWMKLSAEEQKRVERNLFKSIGEDVDSGNK